MHDFGTRSYHSLRGLAPFVLEQGGEVGEGGEVRFRGENVDRLFNVRLGHGGLEARGRCRGAFLRRRHRMLGSFQGQVVLLGDHVRRCGYVGFDDGGAVFEKRAVVRVGDEVRFGDVRCLQLGGLNFDPVVGVLGLNVDGELFGRLDREFLLRIFL